jgi:ketosteroid isomerase-like protein
MSEGNVEIVRRIYEAVIRRDFDAAIEDVAPDAEIHLAGIFPDLERVHRGHDVFRTLVEHGEETWEEIWVDIDRIIDLGARVLVLAHFRATGREGIEVRRHPSGSRSEISFTVRDTDAGVPGSRRRPSSIP